MKSYPCLIVIISFWSLNSDLRVEKIVKFRWFFDFEVHISKTVCPISIFFSQMTDNFILFSNKKTFKKFKIARKIRNAIVDPKCQSIKTAKFWRNRKYGCRILKKVYFCSWPVLLIVYENDQCWYITSYIGYEISKWAPNSSIRLKMSRFDFCLTFPFRHLSWKLFLKGIPQFFVLRAILTVFERFLGKGQFWVSFLRSTGPTFENPKEILPRESSIGVISIFYNFFLKFYIWRECPVFLLLLFWSVLHCFSTFFEVKGDKRPL